MPQASRDHHAHGTVSPLLERSLNRVKEQVERNGENWTSANDANDHNDRIRLRAERQTAVKVSLAATPTSPKASMVKAVIRYLEPLTSPPIVAVFPAPE